MKRRLLIVAGILAVVLVAAVVIVTALVYSTWGETRVRELVERIVTDVIPGRLTVGRLGDVELFSPPGVIRANARGVRFLDPEGKLVIRVDAATVELRVWSLLRGDVHLQRASATGGEVRVDMLEDGRARIENTFSKPNAFRPARFSVTIENVAATKIRFVAKPGPKFTLELDELQGTVDILVPGDVPGATVKLRKFKGVLTKPRPLGIVVRLDEATGAIDTSAKKLIDLEYRATVAKGDVSGRFRYFPHDEVRPAKLSIEAEGIVGKLATIGLQLDSLFGNAIEVHGVTE